MIWFIIAAVIALGVGMWTTIEDGDIGIGLLAGFGTAAMAGILAMVINLPFLALSGTHKVVTVSAPLQSIRDSSEVTGGGSGFLFIGSFYIQGELTHAYYMQQPDGSVVEREIAAAQDKIFQDDSPPSIVCTEDRPTNAPLWLTVFGHDYTPKNTFCTFHVPPGSVANSYSLGK